MLYPLTGFNSAYFMLSWKSKIFSYIYYFFTGFFESILTSGSSRVSTAQLLTFLIQHNLALRASFSNVVLAHQEEVIANQTLFPCLFAEYVNGAKAGERDEAFAQVCDVARGSYGGELNKFLKKPQKVKDWMLKYFPAVESLIKACFGEYQIFFF